MKVLMLSCLVYDWHLTVLAFGLWYMWVISPWTQNKIMGSENRKNIHRKRWTRVGYTLKFMKLYDQWKAIPYNYKRGHFARPTLPFVYLQIICITPSMSIFKFRVSYSAKGQGWCHLWQCLVMRWTRSLGNVDLGKSQWGAKRFGGTLRKAMRGEERYHRGWLSCVLNSIHWLLTVSARPRVEVRKCLDFSLSPTSRKCHLLLWHWAGAKFLTPQQQGSQDSSNRYLFRK